MARPPKVGRHNGAVLSPERLEQKRERNRLFMADLYAERREEVEAYLAPPPVMVNGKRIDEE